MGGAGTPQHPCFPSAQSPQERCSPHSQSSRPLRPQLHSQALETGLSCLGFPICKVGTISALKGLLRG